MMQLDTKRKCESSSWLAVWVAVALAVGSTGGFASVAAAAQPSKCNAVRYTEAGRRTSNTALCGARAFRSGAAIDPLCLPRLDARYLLGWAKAARLADCVAGAEATAVGATADAFVAALDMILDPDGEGGPSRCTAAKLEAGAKAFADKAKCHARAARLGRTVDSACMTKADLKLSARWRKAELKADCLNQDDASAVALRIERVIDQLRAQMEGTRVLRAVGVIADFADSALEDYLAPPPGAITAVSEFREVLDGMEDHWEWMSVGSEIVAWDIVRITLDQALTPEAFGGWSDYRATVAAKAISEVDLPDYDSDGDGVLDAMFVLASSHGQAYDYFIGGASQNGGAKLFVDAQDSASVLGRHIGNFNHEVGHLFGLPDEYGSYDNLNYLTLMSYTWYRPPTSFSAWDRYQLGWLEPISITASTNDVVLYPAETNLQAVIVPTSRSSEYFLIEYRKRPDSGFGAGVATLYDGLAIYHVWEGAGSNGTLPGLIRLEPPDGDYEWGSAPDANDFWFPGNAVAPATFAGRPYYDQAGTLFELGNIEWTGDGGIRFDIQIYELPPPPRHDPDPILNGDFEAGTGNAPDDWSAGAWQAPDAAFTWDLTAGVGGSRCARIENTAPNDAWYTQTITGLTPGETYRVRAMMKVESIDMNGAGVGANLARMGSWDRSTPINQVADWTQVELEFVADAETAAIGCRLGFFGSTVTGAVLCDNVSVEWVF